MLVIVPLLPLFVLFVWISSIHEVIEHGEAYGFTIGMSQAEVVATLHIKSKMPTRNINSVNAYKSSKLISLASLNSDFYDAVKWVVMHDSVFCFNGVTLEFCDERLGRFL
jgi:hypothetical protein